VGLYFGLEARHRACAPFTCVHFTKKLKPSGISLETLGLQNIPKFPAIGAKVAQNNAARKALGATLSVLKLTGAIFSPRSSTPSVRSFYLRPFP